MAVPPAASIRGAKAVPTASKNHLEKSRLLGKAKLMANKCQMHKGKELVPVNGAVASPTQLDHQKTGIALQRSTGYPVLTFSEASYNKTSHSEGKSPSVDKPLFNNKC